MAQNLSVKISELKTKFRDAIVIIGGDLNDAPDENLDRYPPRLAVTNVFKLTHFLSEEFFLTDAWRFMNLDKVDFTWSNSNQTMKSRIDVWLVSSNAMHYTCEVNHQFAPFTDHKIIVLKLKGSRERACSKGYRKQFTTP